MKTTTNQATESRTYTITSKSRGCEAFGPSDLTYTDTVYADGRVVSTVVGWNDGDCVNSKSEKHWGPLDFAVVEAARLSDGWRRVK